MGRSRRRARTAAATSPPGAGRPDRAAAPAAASPAAASPADLRKTLGAYLAGAILLAILVLVATVALAATLAPWLVLAADAAASYALSSWAQKRLAGVALDDEDRIMQTLAGGLLVLVLAFAAVAAVVLTIA
jgi:hypothetical protein